ncbi:hypothetical protein GGE65_002598 [Skermanella aerolata]|jgi:hypothetical protein|uniref:Uncharacterized protein n=1 Tax=Skermanella aerolata TaxID=393310 RepID=A0A512DQE9_9PROT|nr:hypothetical protein [Skermanella aerolata]GEO38675.1 hypothetical protein SAE02_28230 [Skermanella aerolata]
MPLDPRRHPPKPPQRFVQALDNIASIFGPGLIAVDKHELKAIRWMRGAENEAANGNRYKRT